MKYVLIVIMVGSGLGWSPTSLTQVFDDLGACKNAQRQVLAHAEDLDVTLRAFCAPRGNK